MRVLCFGDSNTYGYDPRSYFGDRYSPEDRWVDLLAQKSGWEVLNAGENGREIPRRDGELLRFQSLLSRCQPLDRLVVMLGSNDLLQGNKVPAVASRMEAFLNRIPVERETIVLIAPPPMKPGVWITREGLLEDSAELISAYRVLAERMGVRFVDPADWGIEMTFDGVHFTETGHHTFAEHLYLTLCNDVHSA